MVNTPSLIKSLAKVDKGDLETANIDIGTLSTRLAKRPASSRISSRWFSGNASYCIFNISDASTASQ